MGKTIMGVAAVSLDGFFADDKDNVGPLFDWLGAGDVSWTLPGSDRADRGTRASAETVEAMEQLAALGMEEGLTQALGQIDAILAEDPVDARGRR